MVIRLILLLVNVVLINMAFLLSFLIRFGGHIPAVNLAPYKDSYVFLTLVYMLAFAFTGVYKERFTSFWNFLKRTSAGLFLGALLSVCLFYALRIAWVAFPTSVFLISFPIGLLLIAPVNGLILRFAGRIKKKLVVIGEAGEADILDRGALTEIRYIEEIEDLLQYEGIDEVVICKRIQDAKKLNPIAVSPESLTRGEVVYRSSCQRCHGDYGMGDGPDAAALNVRPVSLRHATRHHNDGELSYMIRTGRGPMPAWQDKLSQDELWDLINYIRFEIGGRRGRRG